MITAMQRAKLDAAVELMEMCAALGKLRSRICWSPEQVKRIDHASMLLVEVLEPILPSNAPPEGRK